MQWTTEALSTHGENIREASQKCPVYLNKSKRTLPTDSGGGTDFLQKLLQNSGTLTIGGKLTQHIRQKQTITQSTSVSLPQTKHEQNQRGLEKPPMWLYRNKFANNRHNFFTDIKNTDNQLSWILDGRNCCRAWQKPVINISFLNFLKSGAGWFWQHFPCSYWKHYFKTDFGIYSDYHSMLSVLLWWSEIFQCAKNNNNNNNSAVTPALQAKHLSW